MKKVLMFLVLLCIPLFSQNFSLYRDSFVASAQDSIYTSWQAVQPNVNTYGQFNGLVSIWIEIDSSYTTTVDTAYGSFWVFLETQGIKQVITSDSLNFNHAADFSTFSDSTYAISDTDHGKIFVWKNDPTASTIYSYILTKVRVKVLSIGAISIPKIYIEVRFY